MIKSFKINNTKISLKNRPYIIAELSGNHKQSLSRIFKLMHFAKDAGASAFKLQTLRADFITVNCNRKEFLIKDSNNLWTGRTLHDVYKESELPRKWHHKIFEKAKELNLDCFSSPFDLDSISFLEEQDVPAYKIASFELTDELLVKEIAKTKKPIIASTGMASVKEIDRLVEILQKYGSGKFALLKCTSDYPANPEELNLKTISDLRQRYECEVGFSDHSEGIGAACCAIAFGATIIEKHLTLNKKDGALDSEFSSSPEEFKLLVNESMKAWQSIGKEKYGPTKSERKSLKYRRSLYAVKSIKKGELITGDNVRSVRPHFGLETKFFPILVGKKAKMNIKKGTPISKNMVDV